MVIDTFSPERTRIERNSFLDEGIAVDVMTIVVSSGSNISLSEFNLSNNYWGTINPEQIAAKILDANDDITLGERVKYEPFLTEPHPIPLRVCPYLKWSLLNLYHENLKLQPAIS